MASGVILLANETPRAFEFERVFSSQGFEISCVLSGIPLSRGLEIFGDLENHSHMVLTGEGGKTLLVPMKIKFLVGTSAINWVCLWVQ